MVSCIPRTKRIVTPVITWIIIIGCLKCYVKAESRKNSSCNILFENVTNGQFSSFNFPSPYSVDSTCQWTIKNEPGYVVAITFDPFIIEESENCFPTYLQIDARENGTNVNRTIDRYCGNREAFTVTSETSLVIVKFRSGPNTPEQGFNASFSIIQNGTVKRDKPLGERAISSLWNRHLPKTDGDKCNCGLSQTPTTNRSLLYRRIVGGSPSAENRFPWMVVLTMVYSTDKAHCGGTLLNQKYVLTAAHCTNNRKPADYKVLAGTYDIEHPNRYQYSSSVNKFYQHPDYDHTIENYDISILELTSPFTYSHAIKPICLPPKGASYENQQAVAAGWGKNSYMGMNSEFPMEVLLPVVDNEECARAFQDTNAKIGEKMMCAGVLDGSKDACQGDSGGPLMYQNKTDKRWHLIGITSYGVKCASPGYYGVYTRVSEFLDYIMDKLNTTNNCLA